MKKEDVTGLIVYVLIFGLALVFCFTVLREHHNASEMGAMLYWVYIVGAILTGVVLNAVLLELAHVLGAKAGRYEIISVCILGLTFYKIDGKTRVKFATFDGLTGETKICPKENITKESNPRPYLLFGSLFYIVEIILVVILFSFLSVSEATNVQNVAYFLLTVGVVGGVILLYNILPFKLDSTTDGYRLTMVTNPKNKAAFNELLRVQNEIAKGNTDVEIKTFETITNFTADLNLNKVYVLLDKRNFDEAEELLDGILAGEKDLSHKNYIRAKAQKIFLHLLNATPEEAKAYYDSAIELREVREIASDVSMPSIRTYILICGLVDRSHSECILTLNNVFKAYKKTNPNRKDTERELFNEALEKVIECNPKWEEIRDYHLEDDKKEKKA